MLPRLFPLAFAVVALHCVHSNQLTDTELAKLDVRLRPAMLGTGNPGDGCGSSLRPDGTTVYSVLIRGRADELRAHDIPLMGTVGEISTAVLTLDEIKNAARLPSVRSVDCGSTNTLQSPSKPQ